MPVPQQAELHHSSSARFQSGNRVYRVVILGQGGVGKSGKRSCCMCSAATCSKPRAALYQQEKNT